MKPIHFKTTLYKIDAWTILKLPETASQKLPSRGLVMVEGTINNFHFRTALEPDGKGSHWCRITKAMAEGVRAQAGDTVSVALESTKDWSEPDVPDDLQQALTHAPQVLTLWNDITPLARWDWIRWIRSTNNPETRKKHIEVAFSKLTHGIRRPCCFNRNVCTEPYVAHNWILREPTPSSK